MSSSSIISLQGVAKSYKIYPRPIDRIREMYSIRSRTYHKTFDALKQINLEINEGETLGIIGPNGSGKSTLLEIICGTLSPSSGSIDVRGRIAALLELGAGFDPAFSGRENVYINAALMGISRDEVSARFDEIANFADIGEFIEHPVSTYSSGMYVRLAFATAIHCDPDVLIVDEALAVGDIRFQRKCYRRFEELKKAGKTILFVTHAVDLVQSHCSRAVYLRSGEIRADGLPRDTIQAYLEDLFGANEGEVRPSSSRPVEEHDEYPLESMSHKDYVGDNSATQVQAASARKDHIDLLPTRSFYNGSEYRWGDRRADIFDAQIVDEKNQPLSFVRQGQTITLGMSVRLHSPLDRPIFGLTVKTVDGRIVYGVNTRERKTRVQSYLAGETLKVSFRLQCWLIPGDYFVSLGVALDDDGRDNIAVDRRYDAVCLSVVGDVGDFGVAFLNAQIALENMDTVDGH
jgi:lipopolysaccharide transport system ATP-binding protein